MKKTLQLLPTLLLAAALTACTADYDEPEQPTTRQDEVPADSVGMTSPDNPEKDYTVISTVPVSDDVKAFFDEALPDIDLGTTAFTFDEKVYEDFYVINSEKELSDVYIGKESLPQLDFEKYTLIIGKMMMGGSSYYLESIYLQDFGDNCVLTVQVLEPQYRYSTVYDFHFWGLFPKIEKEIDKDILRIKIPMNKNKDYDE